MNALPRMSVRPLAVVLVSLLGCPKRVVTPDPVEPVIVPPSLEWVDVQAGVAHTCGLTKNGQVRCWGSDIGPYGEDACQSRAPGGVFDGLRVGPYSGCADGAFPVCWGAEDQDIRFRPIHNCTVTADNQVECFGENNAGQATPPADERFVKVAVGGEHSCGITMDKRIRCWGSDAKGQSSPFGEPAQVFDCVGPRDQDGLWKDLPGDLDWGLLRFELKLLQRLPGLCDASPDAKAQFDSKVKELTELLTGEPAVTDYPSALVRIHMELLAIDVMRLTRDRYYAAEYCCQDCYYMAAMGLDRAIEYREQIVADLLVDQRVPLTAEERRRLCLPVPISLLMHHAVTDCDVRRLTSPIVAP